MDTNTNHLQRTMGLKIAKVIHLKLNLELKQHGILDAYISKVFIKFRIPQ